MGRASFVPLALALVGVVADEEPVPSAAGKVVVTAFPPKPGWCRFIPEAFQPDRCRDREDINPGETRCAQLSAAERDRTPACSYSETEAVEFAYLSSAAFCYGPELDAWECGSACRHAPGMQDVRRVDDEELGAHAYVGRWRRRCLIAFRGTDSFEGWVQSLRSWGLDHLPGCSVDGQPCHIGEGFLESYRALAPRLKQKLSEIGCSKSTPLAVTGHSMGAALATLAAFDLKSSGYTLSRSYTFGQPRVGDAGFATAFNAISAEMPFFRLSRSDDPVIYLPAAPRFHHVGTEVYYVGDTTRGYKICDGSGEDRSCAGEADDVALLILQCLIPNACGHTHYLVPAKPDDMGPSSCHQKVLLP
mmetsp:Transcript_98769/g.285021  ORF Transcript_98769/g.285021 Transcript_98769/m.285021 type:complete len:361 (+) Transcript_98769:84-1166(+)